MVRSRSDEGTSQLRAHELPLEAGAGGGAFAADGLSASASKLPGVVGHAGFDKRTERYEGFTRHDRPAHRIPVHLRIIEIIVALLVLVIFAPILVLVALVIRIGTPGPVLFWQPRVGIDCKLFRFVKYRTLYVDARRRFPELYAYKYSDHELRKLKFKIDNDPRVTPQGNWLRRSTLDELPNFWNVLKGDMALVGPRPDIPEMLPYYKGEMLRKFDVRPGITGLAQVSGRGRLGFYETVALDVEYVRKRSLWFDAKILLKTLKIVLVGDGAF